MGVQSRGVMPEFINPKWDADRTSFKPARLETLMQDVPWILPKGSKIGFCMMDRWFCFTALKNNVEDAAAKVKQGIPADTFLSTEADIYTNGIRILRLCPGVQIGTETTEVNFKGIGATIGARAVVLPEFGLTINQIRNKIGSLEMTARSLLILDGESGVKLQCALDGALDMREITGDIPREVRNDGRPLARSREFPEETHLCVPKLVEQIRGYRTT